MAKSLENTATVIESFRGAHRFLSNFWPAEIEFEGATYASVEHAYQAAKCVDPAEKALIGTAATAGKAKRLSRRVALRADWESVKVGIMRQLVRLKFTTHADLAEQLLATGDAELVEGNTWNDTFWGVCHGRGQNWLGRILMDVREELRAAAPAPLPPTPSAPPEGEEQSREAKGRLRLRGRLGKLGA